MTTYTVPPEVEAVLVERMREGNLRIGDRVLVEAIINEVGVKDGQPLIGVAFCYERDAAPRRIQVSVPVSSLRSTPPPRQQD